MRKAFIETFSELAAENKDLYLLTGDLGFSVFEDFLTRFPEQYLNCGVAEQNMMGVAAGMALCGKKVFAYSIIPFATMRPFEQVRNDICMHEADVTVVGVGGGYSYGQLGATHHAMEDVALMRALPNMTVLVPADPLETELAVRALAAHKGPGYLRLGKSKEENLHVGPFDFKIGKANVLREGDDIAVIGMGPILKNVLQAAELVLKQGVSCRVISMPTLKPIDQEEILKSAELGAVMTVEEHSVIGGLGDAVAGVLVEYNFPKAPRFKKIGVQDRFMKIVGDQDHLRAANGLSPEQLAASILALASSKNT